MVSNPYRGPLRRVPCPNAPRVPYVKILRPKKGCTVRVVSLSQQIMGVEIHYRDRLSIPCTGVPHKCPGCVAVMPKKWRGYIVGLEQPQHKLWIVEFTPCAYRECLAMPAFGMSLRGRTIGLYRMRHSDRAKVQASVSDQRVSYELPECPDLEALLQRIWGIEPEEDGGVGVLAMPDKPPPFMAET